MAADYFIPNSTYKKMRERDVVEQEVHDVWVNGETVYFGLTQKGLKRRYESRGYEVGLSYARMDI